MNLTVISSISAILISTASFIISFLIFKRERRKENENQIYHHKIEAYYRLLDRMSSLLDLIDDSVILMKEVLKSPNEVNLKDLNKLSDKIDKRVFSFSQFFAVNSLLLPNNIIELVEKFQNFLYKVDPVENSEIEIEKINNKCHELADEVLIGFRKDLHVDALNSLLFARINKSTEKRSSN